MNAKDVHSPASELCRLIARRFCELAVLAALILQPLPAVASTSDPRVESQVWQTLDSEGEVDVLLILDDQPDLTMVQELQDKTSRGEWVYNTLRRAAGVRQQSLMRDLDHLGVSYRRYWIVNGIAARLNQAQLNLLLRSRTLTRVVADLPMQTVTSLGATSIPGSAGAPEWGVQRVEAPWAWSQGITGEGVVVAGQDTGISWEHSALSQAYRGLNTETREVDHDFSWHDAIHSNIGTEHQNSCGYDSIAPCDDTNHGTHTMGTIVGNDLPRSDAMWPERATNAIGVAPGAEWIGCRNMENGAGRPSTYIECFEWFVAPYPAGANALTDGQPGLAPDIINNSWGCPPLEGCYGGEEIQAAVDAATAAGILVVASVGNTGPMCGSVSEPPALYPNAWSVGAVTEEDALSSSSSRGPLSWIGESVIKPDVTAPGVSVRSSLRSGGYGRMSGTSMAAPHASGVAALLLSADVRLRGRPELLRAILERTADARIDTKCGGDPIGVPNNGYGWGIVNARRAIESLRLPGRVTGSVRDAVRGEAVAGAVVKLDRLDDLKASAITFTDAGGSFSLPVDWGVYTLRVSAGGYGAVIISPLHVVGGQVSSVSAELVETRAGVSELARGFSE